MKPFPNASGGLIHPTALFHLDCKAFMDEPIDLKEGIPLSSLVLTVVLTFFTGYTIVQVKKKKKKTVSFFPPTHILRQRKA